MTPKKITILLSKKQEEVLAPLYKKAERKPHTGMIIGQFYEGGFTNIEFATPEQLIKRLQKVIADRDRQT